MADDAAALSPAVAKPAHVPDALVYDFDYFKDPGFATDPHGRIAQMLQEAPEVFWTPRQGVTGSRWATRPTTTWVATGRPSPANSCPGPAAGDARGAAAGRAAHSPAAGGMEMSAQLGAIAATR